jgi:hypothetical protein
MDHAHEHQKVEVEVEAGGINALIIAAVNETAEIEDPTGKVADRADHVALRTVDVGAPNGGLPSQRPNKTPPPTSAPKRGRSKP